MNNYDHEMVEKNVRRAAGIHALRKIGEIVAEEQQVEAEKTMVLRWFARFGWVIMVIVVLLFSYIFGLI